MTQSQLIDRLNALFVPREGQSRADILKDLVSFQPTRHVVNTAGGIRLFTYCAVDTLLIAHLLDENCDIETIPPGHTESVRIGVYHKRLRASITAVIAIPMQHDENEIRTTFCPFANIFPDEDTYHQWEVSAPIATSSTSIGDAFQATLIITDRLKNHEPRIRQRANCCSS
jgi:hypothetical protein